ncbi:MAG: glycoside hydrolase [Candidatus Eisenbacteria bacterium]|uniref:Glycoside hydrolase n=1 Tax=Eiseniibacteriota bacterium TaxID=2212470 RepID=A0A538T817_UNCEI|nr:MAG: glycoside hydrolase [Candidatus Eisenbacteria bacterium]
MAESTLLALVWHMHQPSYRDALTGRVLLPWTRLHATKDYRDMVSNLRGYPRVHATFNLTPVLLDQLEAIAAGVSDDFLDLARKPAESLTPEEQRFLTRDFFSVNPERMLEPHARYRELRARAAATQGGARAPRERPLAADEIRDLQTWFHLAWVDPVYREEEPIRSLFRKGRGFTEAEKQSLLDWGVGCAARVIETYRDAARSGQIEIATSAYHHPILPLLLSTDSPREVSQSILLPVPAFRAPEDAADHLRRARESHTRRFGAPPRGTWPPEGAVSQAALELVREAGFAWCASDEAVLARALGRAEPGGERWAAALYRPYRIDTERGAITMVFRDRALSDRIGFTYMAWQPDRAAEDFVTRVREAGSRAREQGASDPLVTVILDGENCWESYADDGKPFLDALYGRLSSERGIEAVTVGEALARVPPGESLPHVPVGSWIAADLSVWIGHPEKNRAWAALRRLRERFQTAAGSPEARVGEAYEEILVAEASDWLWWYGDDHQSAHKDEFDALFRSHLIRAYNLLGLPAPAATRRSLRDAPAEGVEGEHVPYIAPTLDGRDTHFYEWRNAELFDAASDQGADHRSRSIMRRVLFGLSEKDLFVRVDGVLGESRAKSAILLRFTLPRTAEGRVPLDGDSRGALQWIPAGADRTPDGEDPGEYAIGEVIEIRVPFRRLEAPAGTAVHWRVALEQSGQTMEVIPRLGEFATPTLDPSFHVRNWSAT